MMVADCLFGMITLYFSQVKDTENVRVVAEYLINIATTSKVSIFTLAVANILSLRA